MFVGPVTHVLCDLSTQERIRDARRDTAARAASGRRTLLERFLRRAPRSAVVDGSVLVTSAEDLSHALRY